MVKSQKQIREERNRNLAKGRAVKARKAGKRRGLMGLGLGNLDFSKTSSMDSLKSTGCIVLGYAGGQIGGKLIEKAVVKPGDENGFKKFIPALVQTGGGFLISAAGGKHQVVKVLGQGIMASGVVSAIESGMKKQITDLVGAKKTEELSGLQGREFEKIDEDLMVSRILDENLNEIMPEDIDDLDNSERSAKREFEVKGIAAEIEEEIQEPEIVKEYDDDLDEQEII
ncbi:MAG: hypothetical protein PF448_06325 [Bacteroidales bacterium]|jgi:hypothetical protein|nr:hypothetical protein [Bacteroidales bacterium]